MKKIVISCGLVLIIALSANFSFALLLDRGKGLVYDSDLNITWLSDGNYSKTSGYDDDGHMVWSEAYAWVNQLEYAGYSDWRLPFTESLYENSDGAPFAENEMLSLYNNLNDNPSLWSLFSNIYSGEIREEPGGIGNAYWSSQILNPIYEGWAYRFYFSDGQAWGEDSTEYWQNFSMAVRDGDVATPVPEPSTFLLLCCGLTGLCFYTRNRKKA